MTDSPLPEDGETRGEGFRPGVRLGIDWGDARIGVAACDPRGVLAYPVEAVKADQDAEGRLAELVAEYEPFEILVGLPRSLDGTEGPAARKIRKHARSLAKRIRGVRVRFLDERLTTVSATRALNERGRSTREQRAVIDQVAAVTILEHGLDIERRTGSAPGEPLRPTTRDPG